MQIFEWRHRWRHVGWWKHLLTILTYFGQASTCKCSARFLWSSLLSIAVLNLLMLSMLTTLSSLSINETSCLPTLLRSTLGYQSTSFDAISSGCWIEFPASFILLLAAFDKTVVDVSYSFWFVSFCFHEVYMAIINILV